MTKKQMIGFILAALFIVIFAFVPSVGSLSGKAVSAAGIMLAALILWITEALPMSITTLLMLCLLGMEGIMPYHEAMESVGTGTMMFIMASSGMTVAMASSALPKRMTSGLLKRFGNHAAWLVISLGLLITLCSAFMSSLATCALFMCIINTMFPKGTGSIRRCMMLVIPACAGIGGFMSPAGTPANMLLLDYLYQNGVTLSFAQWCGIGFPIGITAALFFLISALLFFHPTVPDCSSTLADEPLTHQDRITAVILILVIAGWFASSWVAWLSIGEVAILGLVVMFLPFVGILNWKSFSNGVNWDLVITMGTVSVLMTGISSTGLIEHITNALIWPLTDFPPFLLLCTISLIICLIRAFIPTTTAVVTLLAPMLITIAQMTGQNVAVLLMSLAFWTASALLLVYTEPIYLITYQLHDYKAGDLLKVGIIPSIALSVFVSFFVPLLIKVVHVF